MNRYYITIDGTGGSLAVEKHLYKYLRETYEGKLIYGPSIPLLLDLIRAEQSSYLKQHRGKEVNVSYFYNDLGRVGYIHAGSVTMRLHLVTGTADVNSEHACEMLAIVNRLIQLRGIAELDDITPALRDALYAWEQVNRIFAGKKD